MKLANWIQYFPRRTRTLHSLSSYNINQQPQASYGTTTTNQSFLKGQYTIIDHTYDAVIVGAGGAGLRTASYLAKEGFKTACISKVLPNRSQTVAANEGLNVQLRKSNNRNGSDDSDNTMDHFVNTCKSSQFLADVDSAQIMVEEARRSVLELESEGFPFARSSDGQIKEKNFRKVIPHDHNNSQKFVGSVYTENGIGHSLLETFLSTSLKYHCNFFLEYFVLDLIMDEQNTCRGVICMSLADGTIHRIRSHYTILAAGGYSGVFPVSTSTRSCTGDGLGIASRAGIPLQDLELIQITPTCLYGSGYYLTRTMRTIGGLLVNSENKAFMEKYAPVSRELYKNETIARAMQLEIEEGRGIGESKDHLHLQMQHIDPNIINQELPGLVETLKFYANIDITKESIPVCPTVHKTVGGVPTDCQAQVMTQNKNGQNVIVPGLLSVGENACSGTHGAVIMEGNSLSEVIAFGKLAAQTVKNQLKQGTSHKELPFECEIKSLDWLDKIRNSPGNKCYSTEQIKTAMQTTMQGYLKLYINETEISSLIKQLDDIYEQSQHLKPIEKSLIWNTDLIERLELQNLLACSKQILQAGFKRMEIDTNGSRKKNDCFQKHSLTWINDNNKVDIAYKDTVIMTKDKKTPYPFLHFY